MGGFGDGGNRQGMSESQKEERMKTKKKRSGLCPQNKDGERGFYNWPFPPGPRLTD